MALRQLEQGMLMRVLVEGTEVGSVLDVLRVLLRQTACRAYISMR